MDDVQTAKVWTMVLLGLISMILGAIPLKLGPLFINDTKGWKKVVISILLCFGGGVLFATSIIHMLPEVIENVEMAGDAGLPKVKEYPTGYILFCCGFFLIYLIEELVHSCLDKSVHENHNESIKARRAFSIHSQACEAGISDVQLNQLKQVEDAKNQNQTTSVLQENKNGGSNYNTFHDSKNDSSESSFEAPDVHHHIPTSSSLRDFLVVLALTFHAVLEGIAVGLEGDVNDVWLLFAAVATHKYVMSFCVGLELYMAKTRLAIYVIYIFVWSVMSPVGIGIGLAVLGNISHPINYHMSIAILQALAAGTILYVVAFEILERERSKSISGLVQLCFVIVGFAAMMTVEILAGHHHGDDDHHHDE